MSLTPSDTARTPAPGAGQFALRLLDAVHGRPVRVWSFGGEAMVRIGRLEDNEVVLADPSVSRLHATIRRADGCWELSSLGKHGVFAHNRRVETVSLEHEIVFRLGASGPVLQFLDLDRPAPQESELGRATMDVDNTLLEMLEVDEARAAEEVREITENESFQRLLERARELRERRSPREG